MGAWEPSAGQSDEWYTPKYIFDALDCEFDMDVAAPRLLPAYIGDRLRCRSPKGDCLWLWKDSLETPWQGFVWMNPPFGGRNGIAPWLTKFFDHGNGIALTPDRTSAPWFRDAWMRADLVMFLPKVKFERPDGSVGKQPGNGTALWASGVKAMRALHQATDAGLGILAEPCNTQRLRSAA